MVVLRLCLLCFVCLLALLACLLACLVAWLLGFLVAWLLGCLVAWLPAGIPACLLVCLFVFCLSVRIGNSANESRRLTAWLIGLIIACCSDHEVGDSEGQWLQCKTASDGRPRCRPFVRGLLNLKLGDVVEAVVRCSFSGMRRGVYSSKALLFSSAVKIGTAA